MIYWYKDQIYEDQPFLAPSISVQRGDGVFESILTKESSAFLLDRHLRRMREAGLKLGIETIPEKQIQSAILKLLSAKKFTGFARLRINYFSDAQFYLSLEPTELNDENSKLTIYPFVRYSKSLMSGIKSTSYAESAAAVRFAQQRKFTDSLIINELDQVVETGFSSFIYRLNDQWFTPTSQSGCLPGIIREVLIEKKIIQEQDLLKSNLSSIDSAAVLSSIRLIQLVKTIEQRDFSHSNDDLEFLRTTRELLLSSK